MNKLVVKTNTDRILAITANAAGTIDLNKFQSGFKLSTDLLCSGDSSYVVVLPAVVVVFHADELTGPIVRARVIR